MFFISLLVATTLASSDARVVQAEQFIEARDCDALLSLFPKTKEKSDKTVGYARLLVRGAGTCRSQDKVLALALTERAAAFAPTDYGVLTAHAESLLELDQRTEGEKILDDTIRAHPDGAVRARYLRGVLADAEGDSAVAVSVLTPIQDDPEYGDKVKALLQKHQDALRKNNQEREDLKAQEAALAVNAEKAQAIASARGKIPHEKGMPRSGAEVWGARGTVATGASRSFQAKNVKAGFTYEFWATGTCTRKAKKQGKLKGGQEPDLFGMDFRVSVGSLDPMPLKVGLTPQANRLSFRAMEDNPQILIEDRSSSVPGVKCTVSSLGIRAP